MNLKPETMVHPIYPPPPRQMKYEVAGAPLP